MKKATPSPRTTEVTRRRRIKLKDAWYKQFGFPVNTLHRKLKNNRFEDVIIPVHCVSLVNILKEYKLLLIVVEKNIKRLEKRITKSKALTDANQ